MKEHSWQVVEINWDHCPWISEESKKRTQEEFRGQPDFLNSLAGYDFMPLVEDAVINGKALDELLANPPIAKPDGSIHAFCDFAWSGSGDLNVLAVRRGNVVRIEAAFSCGHLISSKKHPEPGIVERFAIEFHRLGLESDQISGDEGGGGKLVMDEFDRMGWSLNRINNGSPANDVEHYANKAAEMWYEGGKHITLKTFTLPNDMKLRAQLLSRKRKKDTRGKLAVEAKDDMRKRGLASPDLADAVLGCMMPNGGYANEQVSYCIPIAVGRPDQIVSFS
jgi:hypothetical protein